MIKALTFDLDNTLIDFMKMKREASDAAAKAMVKAGLNQPLKKCKEELFNYYLKDIEGDKVFQRFLKARNCYSDKILAAGINAYLKAKETNLKPYPKVKQTLLKLKKRGIKLAIVTDAPRLKAYQRLDAMKLANLFDVVIGYEDTGKVKPSKTPFLKALELLKVKPSEAMHIGDRPEKDLKGAKAAGMKTCLADYGYIHQPHKGFIKPDYKIRRIEELLRVVNNNRGKLVI